MVLFIAVPYGDLCFSSKSIYRFYYRKLELYLQELNNVSLFQRKITLIKDGGVRNGLRGSGLC